MSSIDELIQLIESAPLVPKPECRNLFYVYDWKSYVQNKFARTPLEHHSFYNSFKISKESGETKFRAKLYPQDPEYGPLIGIQLLKPGIEFSPIGPTEFRIHKLELDKVFRSLQNYFSTMPLKRRIKISSSWEALRKTLESLPNRKDNLPKMKIADFPKQAEEPAPEIPEHVAQFVQDTTVPELKGETWPGILTEGDFNAEVALDADIVVYTKSKSNRPWVGRVAAILPGQKITIHWYKRRSRGNTFYAMVHSDGSPVLSEQSNSTVMYWHISEEPSRTENSFQLSYYWLEKISQDYLDHDAAYE